MNKKEEGRENFLVYGSFWTDEQMETQDCHLLNLDRIF